MRVEKAKHNASMLLYAMGPCYFVLSILMIGVSFFLIFMVSAAKPLPRRPLRELAAQPLFFECLTRAWQMVTGRDHGQWWFIALEAMITATIVVEVTLQIVSQTNRGGSVSVPFSIAVVGVGQFAATHHPP